MPAHSHPNPARRLQPRLCAALTCLALVSVGSRTAHPQAGEAGHQPEDADQQPVPVEQPLPYSHKLHVAMGMQCRDCHSIPEPGFLAGYPAEATCMACHTSVKADSVHIRKLAQFSSEGRPVPWNRVYRVPDFVWFSHASHVVDAAVSCEVCHGPVAERDALFQERPTTMASCMECHAEYGASNDCDLCHDPG